MTRNRRILKTFAVFFVVEGLMSTLAPAISWALTSGPTAPEATSFEPVDTTDMVNLATGDLVYNIPLLEVPGPAGGYPLSLSYHAGIQPNEDASWVGLGWSLNPGALNRSVSGYVDDHNGVSGLSQTFWEGGTSKSYTFNVNYGIFGGRNVAVGVSHSEDTYQGFSHSWYAQFDKVGMGVQDVNGASTAGINVKGISISSDPSNRTRVSYGHSGMTGSSMDVSMASTPRNALKSATGWSIEKVNKTVGNINTKGYNYMAFLPLPYGGTLRLGKAYQRYWIDETENVLTNGALYFPTATPTSEQLDGRAFDVYDLMDPQSNTIVKPEENVQGSFIDYDHYQVLAQGISGSIKPYHYKSYLLRQNEKDKNNEYRVKSYPLGINPTPSFRFMGDFSNRFKHTSTVNDFNVDSSPLPLGFSFSTQQETGENGNDGMVGNTGLYGSKNIQWYRNAEILNGSARANGLINCNAVGFTRDNNDQIGGFKITNSSGITYHYALPAYSFGEYMYSGRVDDEGKHSFNVNKKPAKYAYTWFLTAVTGPDFVDRNGNGYADKGDWGYWVAFDYGKWSGNYSWRTPSEGFNKDIDQNFSNFSKGVKEVYYLNTIRTQTHTALFVKELRLDGKSVVPEFEEAVQTGQEHNVTAVDDGGFLPKVKSKNGTSYNEHPVSVLKLKRIYLLKNEDLEGIVDTHALSNQYFHNDGSSAHLGKYVFGKNVIDVHDVDTGPLKEVLATRSLRTIDLSFNYLLCPKTANSFRSVVDVFNTQEPSSSVKEGKLTLTSITFLGRNGDSSLPPIRFSYDSKVTFVAHLRVNFPAINTAQVYLANMASYDIKKGDILTFRSNPENSRYAYIYDIDVSQQLLFLRILPSNVATASGSFTFEKTKNPPYNKDSYDMWGMYKVDYSNLGSENLSRQTTDISATSTDVWSLREITTPLGAKIKIEYEPDRYRSALKSLSNIPIKNIESVEGNKTKIILYNDLAEYGLGTGSKVKFRFLTAIRYDVKKPNINAGLRFKCNTDETYVYKWFLDNINGNFERTIAAVDANAFVVDYDFTDRYPKGSNVCWEEADPYKEGQTSSDPYNCVGLDFLEQSAPVFLGGEVIADNILTSYGGDLRVKKVSIDMNDRVRSTVYQYEDGVTSYEPVGLNAPIRPIPPGEIFQCLESKQTEIINEYNALYYNDVYKKFKFLFANARELPAPGVLYGKTKVTEQIERPEGITQLDGRSEYEFEVFSPNAVDAGTAALAEEVKKNIDPNKVFEPHSYSGPVLGLKVNRINTLKDILIKDYSAIIGSLKRVTRYDNSNNRVSETVNHYLHNDFNPADFESRLAQVYKNQGLITETFADGRMVVNPGQSSTEKNYTLYGIVSQKIKYPVIQTGQTHINYKTGIKTSTENLTFDFYSGEPTQTLSDDGYGNYYLSEVVPAYRVYKAMGPGIVPTQKNMLIQEAASYVYKVNRSDNNKKTGLLAAGVQTWNDRTYTQGPDSQLHLETGLWRKHASYSFVGDDVALAADGLLPLSDGRVPTFPAWDVNSGASVPSVWQKNDEVTLYDAYSHALEATDVNNHYAAARMSVDHARVVATISNGKYGEFIYTGAEEAGFINNLTVHGARSLDKAHTGKYAVYTPAGGKAFQFNLPYERVFDYTVSVWSTDPNVVMKYNEGSVVEQQKLVGQAGSWYLIEGRFSIKRRDPGGREISPVWVEAGNNSAYMDDFRVYPQGSAMVSYVYNGYDEVSHILDNNNLYTAYQYDGAGRLKSVHRETLHNQLFGAQGIVKTSEILYNYGVVNPVQVTIDASSTGSTGGILPSGQVLVNYGKDQQFNILNHCSSNKLYLIRVDGIALNLNGDELTLADGTKALYKDFILTFKNVQSNHTIQTLFNYSSAGFAFCHAGPDGCYDNNYEYFYYEPCGEEGEHHIVSHISAVPEELRSQLPTERCSINNNPACPIQ